MYNMFFFFFDLFTLKLKLKVAATSVAKRGNFAPINAESKHSRKNKHFKSLKK